jgi:uncharacterized iron-regulated membrane protein
MTLYHLAQHDAVAHSRLYRAVWRWHFYAGLIVIPFLLMLALTGAYMMVYSDLSNELGWAPNVTSAGKPQSVSTQAKAALAEIKDGKLQTYIAPRAPDRPAYFEVAQGNAMFAVSVNPYTAKVLVANNERSTTRNFAERLHGQLLIGVQGRWLIEAASSLMVILIATGLYMWWPRGKKISSMFVPDLSNRGRKLWRELHATIGTWISLVLVFFLLTGLAWSDVWGGKIVQPWSGFPSNKWDNVPRSDQTHASLNHDILREVPWPLEQIPMPASGSKAGVAALAAPVTLDGAVIWAEANGYTGQYKLAVPQDEKGVFTVSYDGRNQDSASPSKDRFVHIDQFTGNILADVDYTQYSTLGKAMAWGIALHKGLFGRLNFMFNLAYLSLVIFLCVSGVVMWWKRRPVGQLAAPLYPRDYQLTAGVGAIGLVLGLLFPLGGAVILVFAVVDFFLPKRLKQAGAA